jgi:hypothetical protein
MKVSVTLEKEDLDAIHDVVLDALDIEPTPEQINELWNKLPEDIKGVAIQWGSSDTVFRDNVHEWLTENDFKFKDKVITIGKVTNAEILSSDRRARVSGGLYITFQTQTNVIKDSIVNIVFNGKWTAFKVTDVKIDGENLSIMANEYGYWASKLDRKPDLDLRDLIGLEISMVSDEEKIKQLHTQACWC